MRIIFMGTPDFAVPSLRILVENGYEVVAVLTSPDKPTGRGLKMASSAVKIYAQSQGLTILQPEKLKNIDFLEQLKALKADLQVVVAFRMLPQVVWAMPSLGTLNLHGSLLPQYRGAAPINWAILNGETQTGITTFFLKHDIDTGDLLFQERIDIGSHQTAGELHDVMMEKGAALVLKTVQAIENKTAVRSPQKFNEPIIRHAPKIFKADCVIDWLANIHTIFDHIRGLSPSPTAFTYWNGLILKIYKSEKELGTHNIPIRSLILDRDTLKVAVGGGFIRLVSVQLEGRKCMPMADFLRGMQLNLPNMIG